MIESGGTVNDWWTLNRDVESYYQTKSIVANLAGNTIHQWTQDCTARTLLLSTNPNYVDSKTGMDYKTYVKRYKNLRDRGPFTITAGWNFYQ